MTSQVVRSIKNVAKGYSQAQIKVREGSQMTEISHLTFGPSTEFYDIMDMIDKRLNDKGKNWRHVLKALKVLDYCLHEGSELVVTWSRANLYIIKTLREFQYIDEDGRDVGQNVRVAAKELTSLILDEEKLRIERSDRKSWKSRVTGLDEFEPPSDAGRPAAAPPQRRARPQRPQHSDEDDTEYRLAIEASKRQEEEDRRKRESTRNPGEDDDLAKAIRLSKEEEEARRRREQEAANEASLIGDELLPTPQAQQQPLYTGFNQGYQQGSAVDFFANPIDQSMAQQGNMMQSIYTGYPQQPQQTGYPGYHQQQTGYGFQPGSANVDSYGQQQQQQFQPTGYNPYAQQPQQSASPAPAESALQPGSNNPWAATHSPLQSSLTGAPPQSGSNNPFGPAFNRPQTAVSFQSSPMATLPEQKSLSSFHNNNNNNNNNNNSYAPPTSFASQQPFASQQQQQKPMSDHEARLNALLASGDGMDTFGNTGNLRIPAQHTAPGTFVNSAGSGVNRLTAEATGSNPFLRQQRTGMPTVTYPMQAQQMSATGWPGMAASQQSNPFSAGSSQPQHGQNQDLIQF